MSKSVQLNKYETDRYILQIFQSNTSVCLIISVLCESCEPMLCEPETVLESNHPVVILVSLNCPMRRPSIKKSVAQSISFFKVIQIMIFP